MSTSQIIKTGGSEGAPTTKRKEGPDVMIGSEKPAKTPRLEPKWTIEPAFNGKVLLEAEDSYKAKWELAWRRAGTVPNQPGEGASNQDLVDYLTKVPWNLLSSAHKLRLAAYKAEMYEKGKGKAAKQPDTP